MNKQTQNNLNDVQVSDGARQAIQGMASIAVEAETQPQAMPEVSSTLDVEADAELARIRKRLKECATRKYELSLEFNNQSPVTADMSLEASSAIRDRYSSVNFLIASISDEELRLQAELERAVERRRDVDRARDHWLNRKMNLRQDIRMYEEQIVQFSNSLRIATRSKEQAEAELGGVEAAILQHGDARLAPVDGWNNRG